MSKCKYYLEKEVVSYDGGITWNETGVTRKGNLYEEGSEDCTDPSVQYRWINMDATTDYICDGTNKYYKQKKQVSYDGLTWEDVSPAEYQRGSIYEVNSPDCQPTYRWVNMDISTDYICDGTTKYYKQKKQVSYGGQEWQDVIPYEYQRGDVYETESTDCGYVPPIYRWINMDISTDWICDETTYTKYYKQKKQVSYDEGQTWQDVSPAEYQRGSVYETQSTDCGYVPPTPQYRWVNMDISTDYICDGTTKYYKQKKQVSYDEGQTWTDVTPAEYQRGDVYETESTDCGYVPPTPTGTKFQATYSDGKTYEVECNSNSTLTSGETRPTSAYGKMTSAIIGECVTSIGKSAFDYCKSLTSVTIPDSVTSIGSYAFRYCSGLTSVTIPTSVTSIGIDAFEWCEGLTSVVIPDSVTSIGYNVFIYCSGLTSVTIGSGLTSISSSAFAGCSSLTSVTIPTSITVIDSGAFSSCSSLTSVTIPTSVTTIGYDAFQYCSGLTSVVIPDSVTSIGSGAFEYCSGLTSVTCLATTPPMLGAAGGVFGYTNNCPIYVPANSVNAYKTATYWSNYASRIQAIP